MKKLLCFDIESTGTDPATDRIVQFGAKSECGSIALDWLINPGCPIPAGATEVHGISDACVSGKPTFDEVAEKLHSIVSECDLLGFNLTNFDIPILWEEFYRCGIQWDLSETRVLDAGTLFKRREERTLSAAMQFYCGREIEDAHDAFGDVSATLEVWQSQCQRYGLDPANRPQLEVESNYEEQRIDLAGKLVVGADGRPAYNIGKAKGIAVVDDPGFGYWMLKRDFSANTKMHLDRILNPESETAAVGDAPF